MASSDMGAVPSSDAMARRCLGWKAAASMARRAATTADYRGTEDLLPHDAGFDPERESSGRFLSVDVCCNRDLPASLPFGGGRPALKLT